MRPRHSSSETRERGPLALVDLVSRVLAADGFVDRETTVIEGVHFDRLSELLIGRFGATVLAGMNGFALRSMLVRMKEKPWQRLPSATAGFVSYRVEFARRAKLLLDLLKALDEDERDAFIEPAAPEPVEAF